METHANRKRTLWQDIDPEDDITDLTCSPQESDLNTTTTSDADFVDYLDNFDATQDISPNKPKSSPPKHSPTTTSNKGIDITNPYPNSNLKTNNTATNPNVPANSNIPANSTTKAKTKTKLKLRGNASKPPSEILSTDYEYSVPSFNVLGNDVNFGNESSKVSDATPKKSTSRVPSPPVFDEPITPMPSYKTKSSFPPSPSTPASTFSTKLNFSSSSTSTTSNTTTTFAKTSSSTPKTTPTSDTKIYSSPECDDLPPANFYDSFNAKTEPKTSPHFKRLKKLSETTNPTTPFPGNTTQHTTPILPKSEPQSKKPPSQTSNGVNLDLTGDTLDSAQVPMSECPICFKKIPTSFLETHAQQELDAREQDATRATNVKSRSSPTSRAYLPSPIPSPPHSPPRTRARASKRQKASPKTKPTPTRRNRKHIFTLEIESDSEVYTEESEPDVSDYSSDDGFVVKGGDGEAEDEQWDWEEEEEGQGVKHEKMGQERKIGKRKQTEDVVEISDSDDERKPTFTTKSEYEKCPICDKQVPKSRFAAHFEKERAELGGLSPQQDSKPSSKNRVQYEKCPICEKQIPKPQFASHFAAESAELGGYDPTQDEQQNPPQKPDPFTPKFIQNLRAPNYNQSNTANTTTSSKPATTDGGDDGVKLYFTPIRNITDSTIDFQQQFNELSNTANGRKTKNNNTTTTNSSASRNNFTNNNSHTNTNNYANNNNNHNYANRNNNFRTNNYAKNKGGYKRNYNNGYKKKNYAYKKKSSAIKTLKPTKTERKPKSESKVKTEKKVKTESKLKVAGNGRPLFNAGDSFSFGGGGGGGHRESSRSYSLGGDI